MAETDPRQPAADHARPRPIGGMRGGRTSTDELPALRPGHVSAWPQAIRDASQRDLTGEFGEIIRRICREAADSGNEKTRIAAARVAAQYEAVLNERVAMATEASKTEALVGGGLPGQPGSSQSLTVESAIRLVMSTREPIAPPPAPEQAGELPAKPIDVQDCSENCTETHGEPL